MRRRAGAGGGPICSFSGALGWLRAGSWSTLPRCGGDFSGARASRLGVGPSRQTQASPGNRGKKVRRLRPSGRRYIPIPVAGAFDRGFDLHDRPRLGPAEPTPRQRRKPPRPHADLGRTNPEAASVLMRHRRPHHRPARRARFATPWSTPACASSAACIMIGEECADARGTGRRGDTLGYQFSVACCFGRSTPSRGASLRLRPFCQRTRNAW
jgi:hypothetical protein